MKWIKRYSFLVMILVTGIVYGSGKIIKAAEQYQEQQIVKGQEISGSDGSGVKNPGEPGTENPDETGKDNSGEAGTENPDGTGAEDPGESGTDNPDESRPGNTDETGTPGESETGSIDGTDALGESSTDKTRNPGTGAFHRVEMDYLDDALFIGDSRTSTLYEYAGWENTDFFVKYGLTIWDVWEQTMDGRKLEDVLSAKQYGKIYIMLGINELGSGTAVTFREEYERVVAQIRQMQPKAVIFVQAILHVTAEKDAEGTYINNQEVNARNQEICKLADNETVFWLDLNEIMDNPATGKLDSIYSFDGVHLKVKYIDVWREFLLDHGV